MTDSAATEVPAVEPIPLGVMPKRLADVRRCGELRDAILRYVQGGWPLPTEWVTEYNDLIDSIWRTYGTKDRQDPT